MLLLSDFDHPPSSPLGPTAGGQSGGTQSCPGSLGKVPYQLCRIRSYFYKNTNWTYTRLASRAFKDRIHEHRTDMTCVEGRDKTSLWKLKDSGIHFNVTWWLKDKVTTFNPSVRYCRILLKEKFHIDYKSECASLYKRSEIFHTCLHRKQSL